MARCLPKQRRSSVTTTTTGAVDATRTVMIALRLNCRKRFFFLPFHRRKAAKSFAFAPATPRRVGGGGED